MAVGGLGLVMGLSCWMSKRSSLHSGVVVMGQVVEVSRCFKIRRFSNTRPVVFATTGCSGMLPESAQVDIMGGWFWEEREREMSLLLSNVGFWF